MWSRKRSPAAAPPPAVAMPAAPHANAMVNAIPFKARKLEGFFKGRPLEHGAMDFQIVQVVQELSTAGGVETVAGELARVFNRNNLPNVVLASAVSKNFE